MRIPKFRVYDKHLKIMRDVKYIDFDGEELKFYADDFGDDEHCPSLDIVRNFDEVEIMQSTELFDKNGVEIFEGDILVDEHLESIGKVVYDEGCFYFEFENVFSQLSECNDDVEIRGNIYEHPELLKEVQHEKSTIND